MGGEWPEVTLGAYTLKIGSGATPRGGADSYLAEGPFALIRSQNVLDFQFKHGGLAFIDEEQARLLDGVTVKDKDILVNITGDSVARVCMVDAAVLPARVNQHVAIVRADPKHFEQRFLFYALVAPATKQLMLSIAASGATRNALTKSDLERLRVPKPSMGSQKAVAELLGALDDKIELNRRTAGTLESMARALFRSWFVDFDPVRAKAEGRSTGLPDDLAALFPNIFGGDAVPDGWSVEPVLPNLAEFVTRGLSPAYADEGILVVNQKCIRESQIDFSKARRHDPKIKSVSESKALAIGDILINSTGVGTLGRVAQVTSLPEPATADSHVTIVRPKASVVSANYLGLAIMDLENAIEALAQGSTGQTELPRESVGRMRILVPSVEVGAAFDRAVTPLRQRADQARQQASTLAALRDTLLPKLISGELRIADATAEVTAA
ncbi:restriction endonuclease subunit S [Rubellimicrobium roseum]|uniref:Restriction endonuclease subunit S n=1 Tax=Rubellimicrobium roseum TaxID=687525 RepID=A0A5C4NA46_9RHOB|nr:restriction endonuclease subunit S [Rubellimicrobium roseum]TNC61570.1 restriction endonuclease subunit S [Rubellimicrobium roseum]